MEPGTKMERRESDQHVASAFDSPTFAWDMSIRVDQPVGSMSISPCGRDVVLASRQGLHIIDLDSPYSPPRHLPHHTPWEVADVQWSPFAVRDYWVISTSNQKALVWNLAMSAPYNSIEHVLHAHTRAITDINFSAHHPDVLATCAVDSFVYCWDMRNPFKPSMTFCDWFAGATQVKWNRQDPHIIASSHDKFLRIWDSRKGAYPLRSIEAHDTKIYGVDWNRTRPTAVATCSLDKSVKFWDYARSEDVPERVIRTPFPVWRARHSPFGSGLLAMPQRENNDLHLYDRRIDKETPLDGPSTPVHRFEGHENQVKEFLWRPRGNISDGVDHREFQLVSWGTDRDLRLHKVDDSVLQGVGYQRGQEAQRSFNFTRRNAMYRTFSEHKVPHDTDGQSRPPTSHVAMHDQGFSSALGGALNAAMKKAPIPLSKGWADGGFMTTRTGKQSSRRTAREISAVEWLKGIRVGKKTNVEDADPLDDQTSKGRPSWNTPENLGDEVTQVADKFSKVHFEDINMAKRSATITMNGPWGEDGKVIHIPVKAAFPDAYPTSSAPTFKLEKTSSIADETLSKIASDLKTIADSYVVASKGCLEAVVCYLLGELDLGSSMAWLPGELDDAIPPVQGLLSQSSSEDEDEEEGGAMGMSSETQTQDVESSAAELFVTANTNANVPLPKECGAVFAANGQLVCFFPPKREPLSFANADDASKQSSQPEKGWKFFPGFGRIQKMPSSKGKSAVVLNENDEDFESDTDEFESSSSSSGASEVNFAQPALSRFSRWRARASGSHATQRATSVGHSQLSTMTGSALKDSIPNRSKNIVSIRSMEDLLPSKRFLAEEYTIQGSGKSVCDHNEEVASRHGLHDIASLWQLVSRILSNEGQLMDILDLDEFPPDFNLPHAPSGTLKRADSGLDLSFDEQTDGVSDDRFGRGSWGGHPFGQKWLIRSLFDYFEKTADIQMLGMLSYVFQQSEGHSLRSQPAAVTRVGRGTDTHHRRSSSRLQSFAEHPHDRLHSSTIPFIQQPDGYFGMRSSGTSSGGTMSPSVLSSFSNSSTPPPAFRSNRRSLDLTERPHSLSASPEQRQSRWPQSFGTAFRPEPGRQSLSRVPSPPNSDSRSKRQGPIDPVTKPPFKEANNAETSILSSQLQRRLPSGEGNTLSPPKATNPPKMQIRMNVSTASRFEKDELAGSTRTGQVTSSRQRGYIENYATLLSIWGFEMTRLELLKCHQPRTQQQRSHFNSVDLGWRKPTNDASSAGGTDGLYVNSNCSRCGERLQCDKSPYCRRCGRGQRGLKCSLCDEIASAIHAPCLACGHILHAECYTKWFGLSHQSETARRCPTGCGCSCTTAAIDDPVVQFDEEEEHAPTPHSQETQTQTQTQLHHHPSQRKLSPVAEQVGSTTQGRRSDSWAAWEDLALARFGRRATDKSAKEKTKGSSAADDLESLRHRASISGRSVRTENAGQSQRGQRSQRSSFHRSSSDLRR